MQGASVVGDFEQRARQALKAGADMALVCNDRSAVEQVIDRLQGYIINLKSVERLKKMRPITPPFLGAIQESQQWQQCRNIIERYA